MADEEELSDDEMDALLADLESRSGSGSASGSDEGSGSDDDDVESFLAELDGDDYEPPPESESDSDSDSDGPDVAAARPEIEASDLAGLEEPEPAPMQKPPDGGDDTENGEQTKGKQKDVKVVARGESHGLRRAAFVGKWALVLVPLLAAMWVLGAYLAQWVSAGWLVFVMTFIVVLGVPLALKIGVKRGKFRWWVAGFAVAATAALTAPMPQTAGETMARWGHWPASAVGGLAGWEADHFVVDASAAVSSFIGGLLSSSEDPLPSPAKLGGEEPIDPDDAPPEDDGEPTEGDDAAKDGEEAAKDDAAEDGDDAAKDDAAEDDAAVKEDDVSPKEGAGASEKEGEGTAEE